MEHLQKLLSFQLIQVHCFILLLLFIFEYINYFLYFIYKIVHTSSLKCSVISKQERCVVILSKQKYCF